MYKLGVISTVIMLTLFLAMKGVFIGTVILIMNIAFFAAKLGGLFDKGYKHQEWGHSPSHGYLQKDVHLHIHNSGKQQYVPYSAPLWEPSSTGWTPYHTPHPEGRYMHHPDESQTSADDKSATEPFQIIYPSESRTNNILRAYRETPKT